MNEVLLVEKLDALSAETRRQGRASVAAQASAEACLEAVAEVRDNLKVVGDRLSTVLSQAAKKDGPDSGVLALVMGILPVADAIDRVVVQAERLQSAAKAPGVLAKLFWCGRFTRTDAIAGGGLEAPAIGPAPGIGGDRGAGR